MVDEVTGDESGVAFLNDLHGFLFPFIIFKSYALGEMRYKMFADKYLLVSNELNILNLLLSH